MKIVIAGAYAIGTYLAKLLARDKHDITLISGNSENLEKLSREYDILTMDASPSKHKDTERSWSRRSRPICSSNPR